MSQALTELSKGEKIMDKFTAFMEKHFIPVASKVGITAAFSSHP